MTDNVTETHQKKKPTPMEQAANKLQEANAKEQQKKVEEQLKATLNAARAFKTEKDKLQELMRDSEADKAELNSILKEL